MRFEESLAELKLMTAQASGFTDMDIWEFLPHHDSPILTFESAFEMYGDEE